jgi:hypothetical protein
MLELLPVDSRVFAGPPTAQALLGNFARRKQTVQVVKIRALPLLAPLGALVMGAMAGCRSQEVTLRLVLAPGQRLEFETQTTIEQHEGPRQGMIESRLIRQAQVLQADSEGYRVRFTNRDVRVTTPPGSQLVAEAAALQQNARTFVFEGRFDTTGRTPPQTAQVVRGRGTSWLAVGFLGVEYPEDRVRVGSTWTRAVDLDEVVEGLAPAGGADVVRPTLPITYRVTSIARRSGRTIVTIDSHLEGEARFDLPARGGTAAMRVILRARYEGRTEVDAADGVPISSTTDGTNSILLPNASVEQQVTTRMERMEEPSR